MNPRVVLLHALPLDPRLWEPQLSVFPHALTPRLYDLPGRTMDAWATGLLEAVEGRLVLVGASMGGYLGLAAARRAPERVAGLVLLGSRAEADTPERRAVRAGQLRLLEEGGSQGLWDAMGEQLFGPETDVALIDRARAIALEQPPEDLARAVQALRDRLDGTEILAELDERALVVLGEHDRFFAVDEVDAPHRVVLPGCGHLPGLERPDLANPVLEEAVARWT
ncbi:MAG TPA: alpha/beta hydrolase [Gaiellaceae bacterium]|nr:alpha/beta hydrolase [Gaiellaceae bacterium]